MVKTIPEYKQRTTEQRCREVICMYVSGLKPGQRKVLFCCFKRNDKREVKVAQLAGSVAEMSAYHHGEVSLMMTIVGLAQNFVGSNNLNMLQPLGQFGTRLHGGKDSASPRYIFTMLSPLARLLFPAVDDNLLKYNYDDNLRVEPEWYIPIIPLVLANGGEGIGTGWASRIPNYDVREIINNIHRMLNGEDPLPMLPSYKGFKGTIDELAKNQYVNNGEVAIIDSTTIEITELPIKTWTQTYKENVLEAMLNGTEKVPSLITDYKEYHTDTTVRFVIKMTEERLREAEAAGLHKVFKLQNLLTCHSMVLFDHVGSLKKYESVQDILKDFFELRMKYYVLRKDWLLGMLGAESAKLSNQARFILEKIQGTLVIENKPKKELIRMLQQMGYDSDPVKAWKDAQAKDAEEDEDEEKEKEEDTSGPDYNYLLSMPMWYLTKEKKDELCRQRDAKMAELNTLKMKAPADLWKEDLAAFTEELERVEQKEIESQNAMPVVKGKVGKSKVVKVKNETMPTPQGRRVIPRVTSTMKVQAVKKEGAKRGKKEAGVVMKMEFDDDADAAADGSEMGLTARLTKKVKKEPAKEKSTKSGKQTTLSFKPVQKKNPWSSEGESESDMEIPEEVAPREKKERKAAVEKKYSLSSSEDEFDDWAKSSKQKRAVIEDDESFIPEPSAAPDSDIDSPPPAPVVKKAPAKASKPKVEKPETSSKSGCKSETSQEPAPKPVKKSAVGATKKPAAKKTSAASKKKTTDAKQPSILDVLSKTSPKKTKAAKKPAAVKQSSDSDGAAPVVVEKKPAKKRKPALSSDQSDSSDSDSGNLMARLKGKSTAGKKAKSWEDDDSFQLEEKVVMSGAPRSRAARTTKPVTYALDSDSDDY
uniref:DNA topoisomerase II alpha n=1 Tax=Cyprinus carpio TaxID=7962 RepID=A0A8C1LTD0_CYPCA